MSAFFAPLVAKAATAAGIFQSGRSLFGQVTGLFGGGADVNLARKFSKRCGLSSPITQDARNQLKRRFPGNDELQCAVARGENIMQAQQPTFDAFMRALPNIPAAPAAPPAPPAIPPSIPTPSAFGGGPRMSLITSAGMSGVPAIARAGTQLIGNIFRTSTGKISGFLVGGRRISRKSAVKLAKEVGIGTAAATLGIGAVELAQAILDESTTRRRRRGITARDLANARRVACKVSRMARDLNVKPAARRTGVCR